MLTGIRDVNLKILEELDDRELFNFCLSGKSASDLCSYEPFWRNRLGKKYPDAVRYYNDVSILYKGYNPSINKLYRRANNWKQYYLQTIYYINRIKEVHNFTYTHGDPKNYYLILFAELNPHVQIDLAAELGYIDLLEYFISKGGVYNIAAEHNLFSGAAKGNQKDVINRFWKDNLGVHSANAGLLGAVQGQNIELVKFFIDKGANNADIAIKMSDLLYNKEISSYLREHFE